MTVTTRVFVNYRREDSKHAAGRLAEHLGDRFGLFMDIERIRPGEDFGARVRAAIDDSQVLLAVIGPHWLTLTSEQGGRRIDQPGDWVAEEIAVALRRGIAVVPVLVDGARMPSRNELPPALADLANRHALTLTHESFAADCSRLIETIESVVPATTAEPPDLYEDRDYLRARAAALQGQWSLAVAALEAAQKRYPRSRRLAEHLAEARLRLRAAELDASASQAAAAGRWADAVAALEALAAAAPGPVVTERLAEARRRSRVSELIDDVRAMAAAGVWPAVLAADAELARLDPSAADVDGLASRARAAMAEAELDAMYGYGIRQLDVGDWGGAAQTFGALVARAPMFRDAQSLLALAQRHGAPAPFSPNGPAAPPTFPPNVAPPTFRPAGNPTPLAPLRTVPVSQTPRRSLRWLWIVAPVAVVVAALAIWAVLRFGAPPSTTPTPTPTPTPTRSASASPAGPGPGTALVDRVPADVRPGCSEAEINADGQKAGINASLICRVEGFSYVSYDRYGSAAQADKDFDLWRSDRSTSCPSDSGTERWSYESRDGGDLGCVLLSGKTRIYAWLDTTTFIVTRTSSDTLSWAQIDSWWQTHKGVP